MVIESSIHIILEPNIKSISLLSKALNILSDLQYNVSPKSHPNMWCANLLLNSEAIDYITKDLKELNKIRLLLDIVQWDYIKHLLLQDNSNEQDNAPNNI